MINLDSIHNSIPEDVLDIVSVINSKGHEAYLVGYLKSCVGKAEEEDEDLEMNV